MRRSFLHACFALTFVGPTVALAQTPGLPGLMPGTGADDQRFIVSLRVNGKVIDDAVLAVRRGGEFYVPRPALMAARMSAPPGIKAFPLNGVEYVALGAIPGVIARFDPGAQELVVNAGSGAVAAQSLDVSPDSVSGTRAPPAGGFFNYDVIAQTGDDPSYVAGLVEGGMAIGQGTLVTTGLFRAVGGGQGFTRLDTSYVQDMPDELMRIRLGDGVARGGDWGRPFRFGGIQIGTNFDIQPGFVPFAVPSFAGQAELPSTVDVYLDNVLRYRGEVDQGPFQLNQLPVIRGSGEARVIFTDPLGRQQSTALPFYVSPQILREGLSDFSYEAGFRRRNYQLESMGYDDWVLSGTHRYGLTNEITVEGHSEIMGRRQVAGFSVATTLLGIGELQGEAAGGRVKGDATWLGGVGYSYTARSWNVGLRQRWQDADFNNTDEVFVFGNGLTSELVASAGLALDDYGSGLLSFAKQRYRGRDNVSILTASWTLPVGQSAFASLYGLNTRQGDFNDTSVGLTVTFLFGGTNNATLDVLRRGADTAITAQARHSGNAVDGLDLGAITALDTINRYGADALKRTKHGDIGLALDRFDNRDNARLSLRGGVAAADGKMFMTRRVDDAFGVVSVPGFPGVPITQDNRPAGVTDEDGDLFIPQMISNYPSKIGVDTSGLPITADIEALEQQIIPANRSAAVVSFNARYSGARRVVIQRADQQPISPGAKILRVADSREFRTAYDGEAYLEPIAAGKETAFIVETAQGRCQVVLPKPGPDNSRLTLTCGDAP
ncbi:fimbria/pilus outer membrane usher protein [Lacibacterium aquatile]|uniref:Fimbria/pilus outer membrane usher protein n=1 Tax=Lacibacterium aquatile TaxID=1168082 RepID=A0ABW5DWX4_9PROT